MKTEISAGGLIVRLYQSNWEILLICDPKGEWTFPKGHPEEGESTLAAATREIAEETGLHALTYVDKLTPVSYLYTRDGLVKKTVQYYLFTTPGDEQLVVQSAEGISDAKWVSLRDAHTFVGYPKTNTPLLDQVRDMLSTII